MIWRSEDASRGGPCPRQWLLEEVGVGSSSAALKESRLQDGAIGRRYRVFDSPSSGGRGRVFGQERAQA